MENEPFYRVSGYADKLEPGQMAKVEHSVEFKRWNMDLPELAALVSLSPQELTEKRKASATLERGIFEEMQSNAKKWEEQAAQTLLLDKALEYVRTPEVKHTSNEWVQREDGVWEISNRVYKMCYQIHEETEGDKKGTWLITWGIAINSPDRPTSEKYYYSGERMVVEQKKKRYNAEADAQNYIQGRFDVYGHLFTELLPPVPDKFKRHFYVNGCLLPGYTVLPPERPVAETAETLLAFLEDEDTPHAALELEPSQPKAAAPPKPAHSSKQQTAKKRPAPVR